VFVEMPFHSPGAGDTAWLVKTTGRPTVPCVTREPTTVKYLFETTRPARRPELSASDLSARRRSQPPRRGCRAASRRDWLPDTFVAAASPRRHRSASGSLRSAADGLTGSADRSDFEWRFRRRHSDLQ
jgi:hypothetical protein